MIIFLLFLALLLGLFLSAFCSGVESGFLSVNRGRILHLVHEGSLAAKKLQESLANISQTITTILIGNNLANVIYSSASSALATTLFANQSGAQSVWTFLAACYLLYLGEFLPKLFFSSRPLSRLLKISRFYKIFAIVLNPLTKIALWLTGLFLAKTETSDKVTTNDLLRILQDRKDGVKLTDFESVLISRILVLRRKGEFITVDSLLQALDND